MHQRLNMVHSWEIKQAQANDGRYSVVAIDRAHTAAHGSSTCFVFLITPGIICTVQLYVRVYVSSSNL